MIDKLEPLDDSSAVASKYYGNVNETIEEENSDHSDEFENKSNSRLSHNSSHSSYQRENRLQRPDSFSFYPSLFPFGLGSRKMPKARSLMCQLESETIAEELEEYDYAMPSMDVQTNHCFKLPQWLRGDTSEIFLHNTDESSFHENQSYKPPSSEVPDTRDVKKFGYPG